MEMKQLEIEAKDKPGLLAEIGDALGGAGINIEAASAEKLGTKAAIKILIADEGVDGAKKALKDKKISAKVSDVILVSVANRPGELGKITKKLAEAKVNGESLYLFDKQGDTGIFALKVSDAEKAKKALGLL